MDLLYTVIFLVLALPILKWIYKHFNRVSRFGLSGPENTPFFEDLFDFQRHKYQLHLLVDEYIQKYGKSFAFYHQGQPVVVTTDEKLMYKVLTKENKSFENRKFFIDLPWPYHQMITIATGSKAKLIRSFLKELLKTENLKELTAHFIRATETVEDIFNEAVAKDESIDVVSISQGYIMEILIKAGFSLQHPNQSEFNKTLVQLSSNFTRPPSWVNLIAALPYGRHLVKHIPSAYKNNLQPFIDTALSIVVARRKAKDRKPQDILDALLAAQLENSQLLDEDLLAQAIVLLTAVHSNTSATIAITSYLIAKHPEVQQKLHQQIDEVMNDENRNNVGDFPTFDDIQEKLPYLDQVVNESLRLYPAGFMVMRECTKPIEIDNIRFAKGDAVMIPTYSIHRDPEYYECPNTFDPDRFSTCKPPTSHYLPFGDGYRGCVGYQMALTEIKMYFAKLLKNFSIRLEDEKQTLRVESHITVQATISIKEPVKLRLSSRKGKPATP